MNNLRHLLAPEGRLLFSLYPSCCCNIFKLRTATVGCNNLGQSDRRRSFFIPDIWPALECVSQLENSQLPSAQTIAHCQSPWLICNISLYGNTGDNMPNNWRKTTAHRLSSCPRTWSRRYIWLTSAPL